ncbi:MAG: PorP/SprF family type IX secretion system membrane protein, partial [Bacteroidota bacterium]
MKQIFTTTLFILFLATTGLAQQGIQYSMYMLNKYGHNPAYAGLDNSLSFTTVLRRQWAGIPGTPSTQQFNMHLPLYIAGGGLGLKVENDMIGLHRQTSASLSYAWHRPIGKAGILSLSLGGGIVQRSLDGSSIITPDGIYGPDPGPPDHQDAFLPNGTTSAIAPTAVAGVYFQSEAFEIGIGADNLLESSFNYTETSNEDYQLKRNYYILLAYNLNLGKRFVMHPSVFVKSDIIQTQTDFSMLLQYDDNIFGGASFRGY